MIDAASLDPNECRIDKRSVMIAGHKTSISLEAVFWARLKRAARAREISVNELVTALDSARSGNLSSAIRVFLLKETDPPVVSGASIAADASGISAPAGGGPG
jgi:predicted DNA-binding ribbon-helix-helix protein